MPADLFGARYQPTRELARTPSFVVLAARDHQDGSEVGVAVAQGSNREGHLSRRALGSRMVRLDHAHVVATCDHGVDGSGPFTVFDLPPRDLASELAQAPYPAARVADLTVELSGALDALHAAGIRVGPLHPGHVGLDDDGHACLSPWPLAAPPTGWGGAEAWAPPEDVAGLAPSVAGDIWSLGALLLSALVGVGPGCLSETDTEVLAEHVRHAADPKLIGVIAASMAADPRQRFESAGQMGWALSGVPGEAGRRSRSLVGALDFGTPSWMGPKVLGFSAALLMVLGAAMAAGVGLTLSAPGAGACPMPPAEPGSGPGTCVTHAAGASSRNGGVGGSGGDIAGGTGVQEPRAGAVVSPSLALTSSALVTATSGPSTPVAPPPPPVAPGAPMGAEPMATGGPSKGHDTVPSAAGSAVDDPGMELNAGPSTSGRFSPSADDPGVTAHGQPPGAGWTGRPD
jgi:hypothetical protein